MTFHALQVTRAFAKFSKTLLKVAFFLLFLSVHSIKVASSQENTLDPSLEASLRPRSEVEVSFTDNDLESQAKTVDVGEQKTGEATKYTIWLQNDSSKPLRINKVYAPQEGTKLLSNPQAIAVGQKQPMVVSVEPTKPYVPGPQYRFEVMLEGKSKPITILVMSNISDAITFKGFKEVLYRIPPTWASDVKEESVNIDIELILGKRADPKLLTVKGSRELSFIDWKIVEVEDKLFVKGVCNTSEVPPDTTAGSIAIYGDSLPTGDEAASSKLDIGVRVINPLPARFLPSPLTFAKDQKSKHWIGSGVVRIDPLLLRSPDASPEFTLMSPDRGLIQTKKMSRLIYSVEVHLIEDEKNHQIPDRFEIGLAVAGKEFRLQGRVEK
jgi:hypothetical protein